MLVCVSKSDILNNCVFVFLDPIKKSMFIYLPKADLLSGFFLLLIIREQLWQYIIPCIINEILDKSQYNFT